MSATTNGQPPDVAADVSPTQNVEFVNDLGMYVWAKPTLPVGSPAPTPEASPVPLNTFWCSGTGANGLPLSGCLNGAPISGYDLTDTQVGYDKSLGLWLASTLNFTDTPGTGTPDYVYLAVSNTGDAAGTWTKWSVSACTGSYADADQPLLGWSNSYVGVDILCFNSNGNLGPDNLIVVPNSSVAPTPASSLPASITPPCIGTTPARDEDGEYGSLYLVASVVPGDSTISEPAGCGVQGANTLPYVLEYTADNTGVAGNNGTLCQSNSSCAPLSVSPQFGNPGLYDTPHALQAGCSQLNCQIDANVARITSAQIRLADFANQAYPFLTLDFVSGFQSNDNLTGSQDLWFIENGGTGSWWALSLAGNNYWISYPTIALDSDLDIYLGSTWFTAGIYPSTVWDMYHGL
ncbi:MAG: hypothetical protein ACREQN_03625, partial [Candidatus Binataceae bacterium]